MVNVILNNIIEIISGGTPKTSVKAYWQDGNIGWLSINDFNNDDRMVYTSEKKITALGLKESNTKLLQKNDIIISARGTVGELAQIGTPMAFNQSCFGIRGKAGIVDNTYLYYSLKNYVINIQRRGQGSVFNTINLNTFKIMSINIEKGIIKQQKIASVLSALDDKIELNNKINVELEAMAKTLYDYWFVQFDFPNADGKPYKSSGGEMEYNEVLKREIPTGWDVNSLFNTCDVKYGFPFSTSNFNEEKLGKPVIRIRDILENSISTYSSQDNIEEKYKLLSEDLLVGMDGNFHLKFWSKTDCYLNQRVVRIRKKNGFLPNFVTLFQIEPFIKLREKSVSRTTVGHLSDKDLKSIKMLVPTKALNENLKVFDDLLTKSVSNKKQNQELASLRDWLLPMLMNGQVKVAGAYYEVEEKLGMVAEPKTYYGKH